MALGMSHCGTVSRILHVHLVFCAQLLLTRLYFLDSLGSVRVYG